MVTPVMSVSSREENHNSVAPADGSGQTLIARWIRRLNPLTNALMMGAALMVATLPMVSAATAWTPANLPNLDVWFDGKDVNNDGGVTNPFTGTTVSVWKDKSGKGGRDAVPDGTGPIYSAAQGMTFDGTKIMAIGGTANTNLRFQQFTVIAVTKWTNTIGWSNSVVAINGEDDGWVVRQNNGAGNVGVSVRNTNAGDDLGCNPTTAVTGGVFMVTARRSQTIREIWANGNTFAEYNNCLGTIPFSKPASLGALYRNSPTKDRFLTGDIYEVIVCSTDLSEMDRMRAEGYLAAKWGIQAGLPASHPFKAAAPNLASAIWNGAGDGNWQTGANWVGGVTPTAGAANSLQFSGKTTTTNTNNFPVATTFGDIIFGADAGGFILNGANSITLSANANTINGNIISDCGSANQTVNVPLVLSASRSFIGPPRSSTASTTLSGIISGATYGLTKKGGGTLILQGTNTYTGATTISGGTLSVATMANGGAASPIGQSTNAAANLVLGEGTLKYTGATVSTDRGFTLTAATNASSAIIEVTNPAAVLTFGGIIAATQGSLTKTGAGTLTFTGSGVLNNNNGSGGANEVVAWAADGSGPGGGIRGFNIFNGTVNLSGVAFTTGGSNEILVGGWSTNAAGAETAGYLNVTAGSLTTTGWLSIGRGNGNYTTAPTPLTSRVTVSGGTVTASNIGLGYDGGNSTNFNATPQLLINGGTVTNSGALELGNSGGSNATVTVSSGSYTHSGGADTFKFGMNGNATGTLTISGGTVTASNSACSLNLPNGNGVGVLNLDGGTLTVPSLYKKGGGTGILNFNGGSFKPNFTGTLPSGTVLTAAYVKVGGAKIDTTTVAYTINQPLWHDINLPQSTLDGGLTKTAGGGVVGTFTATGGANGATVITTSATPASIAVGQQIVGVGVPAGATVTAFTANTSVTISAALTAVASGTYTTSTLALTLGGANTYNGPTTITANMGSIICGVANTIPPLSNVNLGDSTTLTLNNLNQSIGSLTSATLNSATVALGTAVLTLGGDNTSTTFAGVIASSSTAGGITKIGTGTQTLSGTNTFTGPIVVLGGTLLRNGISPLVTGTTTVYPGARLGGTGTLYGLVDVGSQSGIIAPGINSGSVQTLTLAAAAPLTLGANSTCEFDCVGAASDLISYTGATGTITLNGNLVINGASAGNTYTLMTIGGSGSFAGTFTNVQMPLGLKGTVTVLAKSVTLGVAAATNNRTWTGGGADDKWSTAGNWSGGTPAGAPLAGDVLIFPSGVARMATGTNDIVATFTSITFSGAAASYTISGPISLSGGITSSATSGTNTINSAVTLTAPQTFSSASGGTLAFGSAGSIINGANTVTCSGAGAITMAGILGNGAGGLTMSGTGTLTLSGANTYTGVTTLNSGIVSINTISNGSNNSGVACSLGLPTNAAGNLVMNGGTLQYNSATAGSTDRQVTIGSGIAAVFDVPSTGSLTLAGIISVPSGIGSVSKIGTGAGGLFLSGANTYSGGTAVTAGTATATVATGFGTGSVVISSGATAALTGNANGTFANTFVSATVAANNGCGTLAITPGGNAQTSTTLSGSLASFTGVIEINPTGLVGTNGKVTLNGTPTIGATMNIRACGTLYQGNGLNWPLNVNLFGGTLGETYGQIRLESNSGISGTITLSGAMANNYSYLGSNNGTGYVRGKITGNFPFSKVGGGIVVLCSNASDYTGSTTVNGGALTALASNVIPAASDVTIASGSFNPNGFNQTIGSLAGVTGTTVALGAATLTMGGSNASTTFAGVISGVGSITKTGSGTMILSNANTYTGTTQVSQGTLTTATGGTPGSMAGTTLINVNAGATCAPGTTLSTANAVTLSGAGTIIGTYTLSNGRTIDAHGIGVPGTLTVTGSQTWAGNGVLVCDVTRGGGTVGANPGWDLVNIGNNNSGGLTIDPTATSSTPFVIRVVGTPDDANFAGTSWEWKIATSGTAVTGSLTNAFKIDVTGLLPATQANNWAIELRNGNKDVYLTHRMPIVNIVSASMTSSTQATIIFTADELTRADGVIYSWGNLPTPSQGDHGIQLTNGSFNSQTQTILTATGNPITTIVTFPDTGTYTFNLSVTNRSAPGVTVIKPVTISVAAVVNNPTVTITPAVPVYGPANGVGSISVPRDRYRTLTAAPGVTDQDQFGNLVSANQITWSRAATGGSTNFGTITSITGGSTIFTAGTSATATGTVTASISGATAVLNITQIQALLPTTSTGLTADGSSGLSTSPVVVTGKTALLSITANNSQDALNVPTPTISAQDGRDLAFTWITVSAVDLQGAALAPGYWPTGLPIGPVLGTVPGMDQTSAPTVSFQRAGTYEFQVQVNNRRGNVNPANTVNYGSTSITRSVWVSVSQTITSVAINGASAITVPRGTSYQFVATGLDQFVQSMPVTTWAWASDNTTSGEFNDLTTTPGTPVNTSATGVFWARMTAGSTCNITAIGDGNATLVSPVVVTVGTTALQVTPRNITIASGDPIPNPFPFDYSGLPYNTDIARWETAPTNPSDPDYNLVFANRPADEPVALIMASAVSLPGNYLIQVTGGVTTPNYILARNVGTLTISGSTAGQQVASGSGCGGGAFLALVGFCLFGFWFRRQR